MLDRDDVLSVDLARSVDVNELLDQANTKSTKTKKKPRCNAHALIDKGFDVELSPDRCNVEIIASAEDLENLRRLGYATVVVRDLLEG